MSLLKEIQNKCSPALIASRDYEAIADKVNINRTRPNTQEIGNGLVLEVLGLDAGNAFLDMINSVADFRHVRPLLEQGRLRIGSPLVKATLAGMVPAVLTAAQAKALLALGMEDDPVSAARVANAMDGGE
jgi:hypothetical protein